MRTKVQLYAVIRIDRPIESLEDAENNISVTKILAHQKDAAREVERLNKLNSPKGVRYFWQATRYYPTEVRS